MDRTSRLEPADSARVSDQAHTGSLSVMLQPGFMVCQTSASCLDAVDRAKSYPGDSEFIHLNCQLAGSFEGCIGRHRLSCGQGEITFGFSAGECFRIRHCPEFRNLTVMITPAVLRELAGDQLPVEIDEHGAPGLFVQSAGTSRKTMRSALGITSLMAESSPKRLLLHAAVLDYLHWHLSAFRPDDDPKPLSSRVCRQLNDARTLLLQDLSAPPTIAELARTVGMNQCKLKSGFKQLFSTSIYACFQQQRMNRARELLRVHNVTETAVILGYTNLSHFSAAYCRQFGCPPSRSKSSPMSPGSRSQPF